MASTGSGAAGSAPGSFTSVAGAAGGDGALVAPAAAGVTPREAEMVF